VFTNGLWIIVLEMCAAFGMAAFIIWWTWPRKPKVETKAPVAQEQAAGTKEAE